MGKPGWPDTPAGQLAAFKAAVEVIFIAILNVAFNAGMTPERWAELEASLRERAKRTVEELSTGR